jgi:hypothetical protein
MRAARTHQRPGPSRRCGVSKQHHCGWKRNSVPVQPLRAGCYRDKPVRDIGHGGFRPSQKRRFIC